MATGHVAGEEGVSLVVYEAVFRLAVPIIDGSPVASAVGVVEQTMSDSRERK